MTKRLFLLLVPLALVLGVITTALLLGAKTGTSKGNYWIYFCRIAGAAAGRDGIKIKRLRDVSNMPARSPAAGKKSPGRSAHQLFTRTHCGLTK